MEAKVNRTHMKQDHLNRTRPWEHLTKTQKRSLNYIMSVDNSSHLKAKTLKYILWYKNHLRRVGRKNSLFTGRGRILVRLVKRSAVTGCVMEKGAGRVGPQWEHSTELKTLLYLQEAQTWQRQEYQEHRETHESGGHHRDTTMWQRTNGDCRLKYTTG